MGRQGRRPGFGTTSWPARSQKKSAIGAIRCNCVQLGATICTQRWTKRFSDKLGRDTADDEPAEAEGGTTNGGPHGTSIGHVSQLSCCKWLVLKVGTREIFCFCPTFRFQALESTHQVPCEICESTRKKRKEE